MKAGVSTKTEQILMVMKVLAWIAFIGFMIKAGVYLITYALSFFNPIIANDLYRGLDLYDLRQENMIQYTIVMAFISILTILQSVVWYMLIKIIDKIRLENPFTMDVAHRLESISYSLFTIWILAVTGGGFIAWLGDKAGKLNDSWNTGDFLFMAGLVFIISQIFKRGVEIQSENELTV